MTISPISSNVFFTSKAKQKSPQKQIRKNNETIAYTLGALSALALVGVSTLIAAKKNKAPLKLADIKFDKGIAKRNGFKFSGTIKDILRNGDSVTLKYEKGKIVESSRKGQKNFTKKFFDQTSDSLHDSVYKFDENGKLISRLRKTGSNFQFFNAENKLTKEFIQNEDGSKILKKFPEENKTITVEYQGKNPIKLTVVDKYTGQEAFVDFASQSFSSKSLRESSKMENGILNFKNRQIDLTYDLNEGTLSFDGETPEPILTHSHYGKNPEQAIEDLKSNCEKFIPEGLGKSFFEKVISKFIK
jgi:hypothetical protein